jgi:hypothetical protein
VAALKAEVNATKTALATEVALKLGGGATVDATLPRFTGDVTCYVDDATGDVVGLQFGSSAPLCSTAGTPRSFAVPADGYIADVKVVVDKANGLVGQLAFVVKSNASLVPTNVVTCGTRGGVGVSVMPKLAALASLTAACAAPPAAGRRLAQATGQAQALAQSFIDPTTLRATVTTIGAPAVTTIGASPQVVCTTTVTTSLTATSPFAAPVTLTVAAVGGGGGAGGLNDAFGGQGAAGGGGGSSAVVVRGGGAATPPLGCVAPFRVPMLPSHLCRSTAPRLWSPLAAQEALAQTVIMLQRSSILARQARLLPPA